MTHSPAPVWIIAGPTASGKTALAVSVAKAANGVVINADSMQVYREIPLISAQPSVPEQEGVPHMLYGHVPITKRMTAIQWAHEAIAAIAQVRAHGQQPILVGGSGLYLQALMQGLSPMPEVTPTIRKHVTDLYDMLGPIPFHQALQHIDPVTAARLHPTDRQRCIRAREIYEASHKPLSYWQAQPKQSLAPDLTYKLLVLLPDRDWLYERINARFENMVKTGAVDEARAVQELNPDPVLTGVQALGLQALRDYLEKRLTLFEAIQSGQTQSRQYAKRQYTWFRGQELPCLRRLDMTDPKDHAQALDFFRR